MPGVCTIARELVLVADTPRLLFDTPANGPLTIYKIAVSVSGNVFYLFRVDFTPFTQDASGPLNIFSACGHNWAGLCNAPLPPGGIIIPETCGLYVVGDTAENIFINVVANKYMEMAP